jgi:hypothetical protein
MTIGCHPSPCSSVPAMNALLTKAALVRVDVYDGSAIHCAGDVATGQAAPLLSRTFAGGAAVRLDIPPGRRTIVMTTYADAAGALITGSACSETQLSGGHGACLSLTLVALSGAVCASDADCTVDGGAAVNRRCDGRRHQCVQCLGDSDCLAGQSCTAAGECAEPCDPAGNCPPGRTCCDNFCVDLHADPLNCGGCGSTCLGGQTLCCNGQCANPSTSVDHCGGCGNACSTLNGTPTCSAGVCGWTCNSNFVHCGPGNSGCDTPSNTVSNCGGCNNSCTPTNASANSCDGQSCNYVCQPGFLDCVKIGADTDGCESSASAITSCGGCNQACDTANSLGASCSGGACSYSGCPPGRADCNRTPPNLDGCECPTTTCCSGGCQPQHTNGLGLGQTYYEACVALGTPGNDSTYSSTLANDAAYAWTDGSGMPAAQTCGPSQCVFRKSASECAVWCYTKNLAGKVLKSGVNACTCPMVTTTMTWN